MISPTHADLMALDLPELLRRLAAHQAARPVDAFAPEMATWLQDKGDLTFAIDLQQGNARSPAFLITVPPQPIPGRRVQPELDFKCMTPTRRHVGHPPHPEEPMPKATPAKPIASADARRERKKAYQLDQPHWCCRACFPDGNCPAECIKRNHHITTDA